MTEKCGRVQGKWDLVRVTEVLLYKRTAVLAGNFERTLKVPDPILWASHEMFFIPQSYQFYNNTLSPVISFGSIP